MPTPQNLDVFIARLQRAGLLVVDPLIDELRHGEPRTMPERTAQSRFVRAVGLSRRKLQVIERARRAAGLLRAGGAIADVACDGGIPRPATPDPIAAGADRPHTGGGGERRGLPGSSDQ